MVRDDPKAVARGQERNVIRARLADIETELDGRPAVAARAALLADLDALIDRAIAVKDAGLAVSAVWNRRVSWDSHYVPPSALSASSNSRYVDPLATAFGKPKGTDWLKKVSAAVDAVHREITRQYVHFAPTINEPAAAHSLTHIDPSNVTAADTVCWLASRGDGTSADLLVTRGGPELRLRLVAEVRVYSTSDRQHAMAMAVAAGIPDPRAVGRLARAYRRAETDRYRLIERAYAALRKTYPCPEDELLEHIDLYPLHPTRTAELTAAIDKLTPLECVEDVIAAMFPVMSGSDVLALAQRFVEAGMNGDEASAWLGENREGLEGRSDGDGTPFLPLWLAMMPDGEDTA